MPANTFIQGILCRGDKHQGWETAFYRNGRLTIVWLAKDTEIQGIPCKAASFWTELLGKSAVVLFHPNGKLARCRLAQDATIEGSFFQKGAIVQFDSTGKFIHSPPEKR